MKKFMSLLLALLLVCSMTACAGNPPEETTTPTEPETSEATDATEATESTDATEATEDETTGEPVLRLPMDLEVPENTDTSTKDPVKVPDGAELVAIAADTLSPDPIKGYLEDPVDPFRTSYDLGACRQLEGDPYFLCIFLDDDDSSWTQWEVDSFLQNKFNPGLNFLIQQASYWGAYLEFNSGYYVSDSEITARYDGSVGDFNGDLQVDVLEQAALSLGFSSAQNMHEVLVEWTGKEQIAYTIILNKPGRSYAYSDWYNDGNDILEYCVLFAKPSYVDNLVYDCPPATVAHELLHLFGAEDYYAEGYDRVQREQLANAYYPNDLMLRCYYEIYYNNVGQFTAYCVGWTDETPYVCYEDGWWD